MGASNWHRRLNIPAIERAKLELCAKIDYCLFIDKVPLRTQAARLNTSQANLSRIRNRRCEKLTLNYLFLMRSALRPRYRILVSL